MCLTTPEDEQKGQIAVAGNVSSPHVHIYTCNMNGTVCQHHKLHLPTTVMKNQLQLLIRLYCFSVSRPEAGSRGDGYFPPSWGPNRDSSYWSDSLHLSSVWETTPRNIVFEELPPLFTDKLLAAQYVYGYRRPGASLSTTFLHLGSVSLPPVKTCKPH